MIQRIFNKTAMWSRVLLICLTVMACIVLSVPGCKKKEDAQESVALAAEPAASTVDVAYAESVPVQITIDAVGTLEAAEDVMVAAKRGGIVKEIRFEEGQAVKADQLLVRLDDDMARLERDQAVKRVERITSSLARIEAEVRRAEAQKENARSNFERKEALFKEEATTRAVFLDAKTALDAASAALDEAKAALEETKCIIVEEQAGLAIAEENLADAQVKASMDGVLGERIVGPGDFVDKGEAVVRLVTVDPLKVGFTVPERYQGRIHSGQKVTLRVQAWPDRVFEGDVFYLAPALDPETRTVKVKAFVDNTEKLLQPGFFTNVKLILEEKPTAIVIPEEAIVPRGEDFFVYKAEGGKAVLQKVMPGQRMKGRLEILSGLTAGDCVIVAGLQRVTDNYPIRIRKGDPATEGRDAGGDS